MFRRILLGLVEGLVIGLSVGVAGARALGLAMPGGFSAGLLGAVVGCLVGLVAGRPIWARDAKTEALLKASVGALIGVGLSFALRRWLTVPVDLSAWALGSGPAGELAVLSLPAAATALSLFFELDHDGPVRQSAVPVPRSRTNDHRVAERTPTELEPDDLDSLVEDSPRKTEKR